MLAALCFVVGAEAHSIGQIFFLVPALLIILGPARRRVQVAAVIYATTAVLMLPRLFVDLSFGGTRKLLSNYDTYTINKGYLDLINQQFYGHPVRASTAVYAHRLWDVFLTTLSWQGAIVGVLATVGMIVIPRRVRFFAIAFFAIYIASMLYTKPAPYPRYFLPLIPGFVLLASVGFQRVWNGLRLTRPLVPIACITILGVVTGTTYFQQIRDVRARDAGIAAGPLRHMASLVDDGKGVIGVRSPQLLYVDDDVSVWGSLYLDEQEYVTYLTWPSDEKVLKMFARHNIGWIYIQDNRLLEYLYPATWLLPTYHRLPRFVSGILASPELCPVYLTGTGFDLWKVGSCPKTDPRWSTGTFIPAAASAFGTSSADGSKITRAAVPTVPVSAQP
jgi:hypothetical protein